MYLHTGKLYSQNKSELLLIDRLIDYLFDWLIDYRDVQGAEDDDSPGDGCDHPPDRGGQGGEVQHDEDYGAGRGRGQTLDGAAVLFMFS